MLAANSYMSCLQTAQPAVIFATVCGSKPKWGWKKEIHMNDLHYTRCGMESLAIQMDVTAMCGGYYFKVNQELEGPSPIAVTTSSVVC